MDARNYNRNLVLDILNKIPTTAPTTITNNNNNSKIGKTAGYKNSIPVHKRH